MKLFERGKSAGRILIRATENSAVHIAVENLAGDIEKVCGVKPEITYDMSPDVVIAVGTAEGLDAPAGVDLSALRDETGAYRWEAYLQQVCGGVLYLLGSDRRGAIYAVYALCEAIGVSPWYDMGDVPVKTRDCIELPNDHRRCDWPRVQYRGIFLNDEEELELWAMTMGGEKTIGPKTYRRIFELILRLGGNYIWPAMHVNAFNINPENGALAERMGVVTGTSHCDMLHRSNQNEWKHWLREKGYSGVEYDYTIPGENRERLLEYWRGSLQQNRHGECCYTIGMRGIHDSGFVTANIGAALTAEELMARKRALLEEIFAAQRRLIAEELPGREVPQSFVPYKEVLPIYDSGLSVPEDVTLIWVDDNQGYVRRYPSKAEQQRKGGNGLYYHSSYWAPAGMHWLFVCSTPLAHMGNELKKCYEQGIRRMWVDNVGALKPIELDMEYFIRCGWDGDREGSVMLDSRRFLTEWIDRTFSDGHGAAMAGVMADFAQLSNLCKPEHMRSKVFSQTAYGDEAAARLHAMHGLVRRALSVHDALPARERDAFFQLVLMKMLASFFIAASYYHADRSVAAYEEGAMAAADASMARSRRMDDLKRLVLHYYNEVMSGGKWRGILTPEDFPPPPLELYPACKPALRMGKGSLVLRLPEWGAQEGLAFDPSGVQVKWFELLNTGVGDVLFTIDADDGIIPDCTTGLVADEKRIMVRVRSDFRAGRIRIHTNDKLLTIPVTRACGADGFIHLNPADAQETSRFRVIRDMGRALGDAWEAPPDTTPDTPACMTFRFTLAQDCAPQLEIIRFLTLNSVGAVRVRASVDGMPWQTVASESLDEYTGNWVDAAMHNGEKLYIGLPALTAGGHTLRIEAIDPYVTLSALNLYTAPRRESLLGPGVLEGGADLPDFDEDALIALFGMAPSAVPPPFVVMAGDEHWSQEMVYARNPRLRPAHRGTARCWYPAPEEKNVPAMLPKGVVAEQEGHLAWEAENALTQSANAWMTEAKGRAWAHRQAETDDRTGLAMWLPLDVPAVPRGEQGPGLHYRICCDQDAPYHLWLLARYDDLQRFRIRVLLDGADIRDTALLCRTDFFTYRTIFMWHWQKVATLPLTRGEHVLTIEAGSAGTAIDRIYMTTGRELPPLHDAWQETTLP